MSSRFNARPINPPDTPPAIGSRKHLSPDEVSFVYHELGRALLPVEVTRMFFRRFGRDITIATVRQYRKRYINVTEGADKRP